LIAHVTMCAVVRQFAPKKKNNYTKEYCSIIGGCVTIPWKITASLPLTSLQLQQISVDFTET